MDLSILPHIRGELGCNRFQSGGCGSPGYHVLAEAFGDDLVYSSNGRTGVGYEMWSEYMNRSL